MGIPGVFQLVFLAVFSLSARAARRLANGWVASFCYSPATEFVGRCYLYKLSSHWHKNAPIRHKFTIRSDQSAPQHRNTKGLNSPFHHVPGIFILFINPFVFLCNGYQNKQRAEHSQEQRAPLLEERVFLFCALTVWLLDLWYVNTWQLNIWYLNILYFNIWYLVIWYSKKKNKTKTKTKTYLYIYIIFNYMIFKYLIW